MKWLAFKNYEVMSEKAAARVFRVVAGGLKHEGRVNLGLATGNTMIRVYELLAERLNKHRIPLAGLSTFNLDEYSDSRGNVSESHPLSYRRYMEERFFSLLDKGLELDRRQTYFPDACAPSTYDVKIMDRGGLDFQLLGIGFNGHIAFNEPISERDISVENFASLPSRVVDLTEMTIQTNARLTAGSQGNLVPRQAATMGMASILEAREILLLACFTEQTTALKALKTGKVTPELPASFLLRHHHSSVAYTEDKIRLDA